MSDKLQELQKYLEYCKYAVDVGGETIICIDAEQVELINLINACLKERESGAFEAGRCYGSQDIIDQFADILKITRV